MSVALIRPPLLAAGTALVIAALTLAPAGLVEPVRIAVGRLVSVVAGPLLAGLPYDDAERLLNTLLFVPLGATLALVLGRRGLPLAILAGFALSAAVEYAQAAIPGRVPDVADVLWNSLGTAVGAVAVAALRAVVALASRIQRGSETRT